MVRAPISRGLTGAETFIVTSSEVAKEISMYLADAALPIKVEFEITSSDRYVVLSSLLSMSLFVLRITLLYFGIDSNCCHFMPLPAFTVLSNFSDEGTADALRALVDKVEVAHFDAFSANQHIQRSLFPL